MNIALIGTRGVPAKYGGFETCAEELGARLAERGHRVTVYCRKGFYSPEERRGRREYRGMSLTFLPELKSRSLETLSHTLLALIHCLGRGFDRILIFNCANSPLAVIPLLFGKKTALHVDGLEWKRGKWSRLGKAYYLFTEWLATKLPVTLICDSLEIRRYYGERYGREISAIPYGAEIQYSRESRLLERFSVEPGGYFLQITRFEPENNPLLAVRAFKGLRTGKRLVLVGGVKYRTEYSDAIEREAERATSVCLNGAGARPAGNHKSLAPGACEKDLSENRPVVTEAAPSLSAERTPASALEGDRTSAMNDSGRVLLPGCVYDPDLRRELLTNAFAYIHGNEVGGTNPALLEAMAAGSFVISRDVPYNREVLRDAGIYFNKDAGDLRSKMEWALAHEAELSACREKARMIIRDRYDWRRVAAAYERLFIGMGSRTKKKRLASVR